MRGAHPIEQGAPLRFGQAVVAKDDPRAVGQPRHRIEQASPSRSSVISQRRGRGWFASTRLPIAARMTDSPLSEVRARIAKAAALAGRAPRDT